MFKNRKVNNIQKQPAIITIDGITVTYRKVKYLRLQVTASGQVKAVAPLRMPESDIRQFIHNKKPWIEKKLSEIESSSVERRVLAENEWLLHGEIHFSGDKLSNDLNVRIPDDNRQRLPWYKSYAKQYLAYRLAALAERHSFIYSKISVRDQKTRWGSCSSSGTISLNWRLIQMPIWVSDYVLLHELCHTKHMNHSPQFWQLVEQVYGDHQPARDWLKQHGRLLPAVVLVPT